MLLERWRHITDGLISVLAGLELGHKKTLQSVPQVPESAMKEKYFR